MVKRIIFKKKILTISAFSFIVTFSLICALFALRNCAHRGSVAEHRPTESQSPGSWAMSHSPGRRILCRLVGRSGWEMTSTFSAARARSRFDKAQEPLPYSPRLADSLLSHI